MGLLIAQLGQPVLRRVAEPVPPETVRGPEFQSFLTEMKSTMLASGGVGLAAPQVFVSWRVFLAGIRPVAEGAPAETAVEVFINPRLVATGGEIETAWEGCLSFPELLVLVPRPQQVRVEYLDGEGRPAVMDLEGYHARVVQHEYDHLDGILTLDRALSTRDIVKASEIGAVLGERERPAAP